MEPSIGVILWNFTTSILCPMVWWFKSRKTVLKEKAKIDKLLCTDSAKSGINKSFFDLRGDELRTIFAHPGYSASKLKGDKTIKQLLLHPRHRISPRVARRVFSNLQGLEEVYIRDCGENTYKDRFVAAKIIPALLTEKTLELDLKISMSKKDIEVLCSSIRDHPSLTKIRIEQQLTTLVDIDLNYLIDTVSSIPNLQDLSLPYQKDINGILLEHLISKNKLQNFVLDGTMEDPIDTMVSQVIRDDQLQHLMRGLKHRKTPIDITLEGLEISSKTTDLIVRTIMELPCVRLFMLKDKDCDEYVTMINHDDDDESLSYGYPLPHLWVDFCNPHAPSSLILEELERNQTLTDVTLIGLRLDDVSCTSVSRILQGHRSIKYLSLHSHNESLTMKDENKLWLLPMLSNKQLTPSLEKFELKNFRFHSSKLLKEAYNRVLDLVSHNTTLKELIIPFCKDHLGYHEFIQYVSMLKPNSTLETLHLTDSITLSVEQYTNFVVIAKLNYGVSNYCTVFYKPSAIINTSAPSYYSHRVEFHDTKVLNAICKLNKAGRKYLLDDQPCHVKGMNVLIAVRDDLHALYLHLLENPNLCKLGAHRQQQ